MNPFTNSRLSKDRVSVLRDPRQASFGTTGSIRRTGSACDLM